MQDIQEIFNRVQEVKKKQKEIRAAYKDALSSASEYVELTEKLKTMRERKKQIETTVKNDFAGEFTKLEDLQIDLASDMEMLSDLAFAKMVKGEAIEIKDQYDNAYEPVVVVRFKKT